MRRKFLTNLLLLLSLNLLIKPFWVLGIDRTVQNITGPAEYGFYFAILNFSFILQIVLDMGITNFNNRNISRNNQLLTKHFAGIVVMRFLLAAVYMLLILLIGWWIGYSSRQMYFLFLIGINQFLLSFVLYLRSNVSALLLFRTDSFLSVLDRLLMIGITAVMIWGNLPGFHFSIEAFVYAQMVSYLLTAVVAFLFVVNKTASLKFYWNVAFFRMIIRKSMPYALLIFLMSMYNRIDAFLIERLLPDGAYQAGIYASAFRFLDVANNMSGVLFAVLLLPIFSKMLKQKKELSPMVKLPFTLLSIISVMVAAGALFYGHEVMQLLYHPFKTESAAMFETRMVMSTRVFIMLMFAYVATSLTYVFGTLLTANGSLRTLNKVAAAGMVLSLLLNFILIPAYRAPGSAMAALTVQWMTALLQVFIAFRLIKLRFGKSFWLRMAAFVLLSFVWAYLSRFLPVHFVLQALVYIVLALLSAVLLGLVRLKAFVDILFMNDKES